MPHLQQSMGSQEGTAGRGQQEMSHTQKEVSDWGRLGTGSADSLELRASSSSGVETGPDGLDEADACQLGSEPESPQDADTPLPPPARSCSSGLAWKTPSKASRRQCMATCGNMPRNSHQSHSKQAASIHSLPCSSHDLSLRQQSGAGPGDATEAQQIESENYELAAEVASLRSQLDNQECAAQKARAMIRQLQEDNAQLRNQKVAGQKSEAACVAEVARLKAELSGARQAAFSDAETGTPDFQDSMSAIRSQLMEQRYQGQTMKCSFEAQIAGLKHYREEHARVLRENLSLTEQLNSSSQVAQSPNDVAAAPRLS
ncbi:hypothetical protein WJX84_009235 [Apatococcus fuscideae]